MERTKITEALGVLRKLELEKIEEGKSEVSNKLDEKDLIEKVLKKGEEEFGSDRSGFIASPIEECNVLYTTINYRILEGYDGMGLLAFNGDDFESLYSYNLVTKEVKLVARDTCFITENIIELVECGRDENEIIVSFYPNDRGEISVFLKANI